MVDMLDPLGTTLVGQPPRGDLQVAGDLLHRVQRVAPVALGRSGPVCKAAKWPDDTQLRASCLGVEPVNCGRVTRWSTHDWAALA